MLLGNPAIVLKIMSWKQSVHGVNKSGTGDFRVGEHRIHVNCVLPPPSWEESVWLVGNGSSRQKMTDLTFDIELIGAQKIFAKMDTKTASEDSEKIVGLLTYYPPTARKDLPPQSSTEMIEQAEAGSISGWALFDEDTLWRVSHLLTTQPAGEIELWLTVRARGAPTEGAVTFEKPKEFHPLVFHWTGNEGLPIWNVAIVTKSPEKTESEADKPPQNEIVTAIRETTDSFISIFQKIGIGIALLLGLLLIELWRFH
jgi:hypothetical protein